MAETYAQMDSAAADGMKTAEDATASIRDAFAQVKEDASSNTWCICTHDGKKSYPLVGAGSGGEAFVAAMKDDGPNFAGLRVSVDGGVKFFHVLFVGDSVGAVKRNKAALLKSAPFNAMEGASGEVQVPKGELSVDKLVELISEVTKSQDVSLI